VRDPGERAWVAALAVVATLGVIATAILATGRADIGLDILLIVNGARRVIAGLPLYDDPTVTDFAPDTPHYYGPPALAAAYSPLTGLPDELIVRAAVVVGVIAAMIGVAILVRASDVPVSRSVIAGVFIGAIASPNVYGAAVIGNPSMFVLPLLAVGLFGLVRDRPWLAGIGIGTAAALRLYPAALLVPLLIAGRWRPAGAVVAVMGIWTLVGVWFAGPEVTRQYVDVALALNGVPHPEQIYTNVSLPAMAWRAGWSDQAVAIVRVVSLALGGAALVGSGLLLRSGSAARRMVAFGIGVAGSLLILSTVWSHYEVALLIVVVGAALVSGRAVLGLAGIAIGPAPFAGGLAMLWVPALGLASLRSRWAVRSAALPDQTRTVDQ
jgi:alpha-1,2-mannosyltransferase